MSTPRQVLPFPDVNVELSVIWGRRRIRISDVHALAVALVSGEAAVADLDDPAQGTLDLQIGSTLVGKARLTRTQPARLEITELFGQTGLVQSPPPTDDVLPMDKEAELVEG